MLTLATLTVSTTYLLVLGFSTGLVLLGVIFGCLNFISIVNKPSDLMSNIRNHFICIFLMMAGVVVFFITVVFWVVNDLIPWMTTS